MPAQSINFRHIGPPLPPGHFVPANYFLYVVDGTVNVYDGIQETPLAAGNYCIFRKNRLARFLPVKGTKVNLLTVVFDDDLIARFRQRQAADQNATVDYAVMIGSQTDMVDMYVTGLTPYFANNNVLDPRFADLKREELLMILSHVNPNMVNGLCTSFNPKHTDLTEFMESNYKFNAGVEQLAFLTGRSLSGFKREFQRLFNETPNRWLVARRLDEARHLITKEGLSALEVYKQLGFEDLSHFSFAFKKRFGTSPANFAKVIQRKRR